ASWPSTNSDSLMITAFIAAIFYLSRAPHPGRRLIHYPSLHHAPASGGQRQSHDRLSLCSLEYHVRLFHTSGPSRLRLIFTAITIRLITECSGRERGHA